MQNVKCNPMKQDLQIFNLIKKEEDRQTSGIELIASENYVSDQVLEALGSICTNKYAEGSIFKIFVFIKINKFYETPTAILYFYI